jgi:hypothetical protein
MIYAVDATLSPALIKGHTKANTLADVVFATTLVPIHSHTPAIP